MVGLLMEHTPEQLPTETALQLLADQQRQRVVRLIAEADDGTTVAQLEQALDGSASRAAERSNGRFIQLRHVHLPKLQQASVIVYDADRGTVARGPGFGDLRLLLDAVDDCRCG